VNLQEIFSIFRQLINDPNSQQVDDANAYLWFKLAYWNKWNKFSNLNEDYGMAWIDVNVATDFQDIGNNVKTYFIPSNAMKIIRVERSDGASGQEGVYPIDINQKDYYYNQSDRASTAPGCWYRIGDRFAVNADVPAGTLRIYYTR